MYYHHDLQPLLRTKPNMTPPKKPMGLMDLPVELLFEIIVHASTHYDTIRPKQLAAGLSQFILDGNYVDLTPADLCEPDVGKSLEIRDVLTAFSISTTCKGLHEIIDGEHVFYKANTFEFYNSQSLLTYIVALPPLRRRAVRSIKVRYDYYGIPAPAFTVLGTCLGLKDLTLNIQETANFFGKFSSAHGYSRLIALLGLNIFELAQGPESWNLAHDIASRVFQVPGTLDHIRFIKSEVNKVEATISAQVTQRRTTKSSIQTRSELAYAMTFSGLNKYKVDDASTSSTTTDSSLGSKPTAFALATSTSQHEPLDQPVLTEAELWHELDDTHRASWDH